MKKFGKRGIMLCLMTLLALLSAGCVSSSTVEDLFTLPQPPIEYTGLLQITEQLIADGYEYASPTGGQNIQSMQMEDLDGDGKPEAIAFFRRPNDEKPLKIMVFSEQDEVYSLLCTIESSGTAVDRIDYEDMNDDGQLDLVVGWKISTDVQTVAIYSVGAEPTLLVKSSYTRYSIQDMDGNGIPSLLVFRANSDGISMAEFYGWRNDTMELAYRCSLSSTMAELNSGSIVHGKTENGNLAVYVTGINDQGMAVTDILVSQDNGTLTNAALSGVTGRSNVVFPYRQLNPQDINGDGRIEIPAPVLENDADMKNDGVVHWMSYNSNGKEKCVATTYHCLTSGWYFHIPETWEGHLTTSVTESGLNENRVVMQLDGDPVLAIYTITGENRENKALRGNRVVLKRQMVTIYAGELLEGAATWGVDEEFLRNEFNLIVKSWMA